MTGNKMNYSGLETEDGTFIFILQEGTKKNYPRQRIVRRFIEGQNRSASESSESMLSSIERSGSDEFTP